MCKQYSLMKTLINAQNYVNNYENTSCSWIPGAGWPKITQWYQ